MMARPTTPPAWRHGRLLAVIAVLFAVQAGLIMLFGARFHSPLPPSATTVHFRAWTAALSEEELIRRYFVGDPDVFLTPSRHGFSGRAWLNQSRADYHPTNQLEQPVWLAFSPEQHAWDNWIPPDMMDSLEGLPNAESLSILLPPRVLTTQSVFAIEGEVRQRLASPPPVLKNWPCSQDPPLLTNSVVQIAVTPAGEVVAARLVARSGSAEADADALAKARALAFRPSAQPRITWAQAVFQWHTAEQTNSPPPR